MPPTRGIVQPLLLSILLSGYIGTSWPVALARDETAAPDGRRKEPPSPKAKGEDVAGLTGVFEADTIEKLPFVGRRFEDLLTLAPGLTDADGNHVPNALGARETGMQYRLDGQDITDPVTAGRALGLGLAAIDRLAVGGSRNGVAFGRFDGGLTEVVSRSGSDQVEGSFRLFWRGNALDGDGAGQPNDTFFGATPVRHLFHDLNASVAVGGPILRERLWYFASIERIDEVSHDAVPGASIDRARRGWDDLVKIVWRPAADHRLSLRYASSPREIDGAFLDFQVSPESGGTVGEHARAVQGVWTWTPSPRLFLDAQASWLDSGLAITPDSDDFHRVHLQTQVSLSFGRPVIQARYPQRECSENGGRGPFVPNCDPTLGEISIFYTSLTTGFTGGPLSLRTDDSRTRKAIRAEIGYEPQARHGDHDLRVGFEADQEEFEDDVIDNPILVDATVPCPSCRDSNGQPLPNAVTGVQQLLAPTPAAPFIQAQGTSSGFWLSDGWRAGQGLVVQAGLRVDRESLGAAGFTPFAPKRELGRFTTIVGALCEEGRRVAQAGGQSNAFQACGPLTGVVPGAGTAGSLFFQVDANTPASIRRFDRNNDRRFDERTDGAPWLEALTTITERVEEPFHLGNINLSPRAGVSWDPWSGDSIQAGKTNLYANWGRYHDRLLLAPVTYEDEPSLLSFTFLPDPFVRQFTPGQLSFGAPAFDINQVDRALRTPRTDVFTLGGVRELSPSWSVGASFTQKQSRDLLQDADINHITCRQYRSVYGIDPRLVCAVGPDPNGNFAIGDDLFGLPGAFGPIPNGVTDLYALNPSFNRVLRVGNLNGARYRAATLEIRRRLTEGWQLQGSYTYSRSIGDGETFTSLSLNDPILRSVGRGPLDWDQRHRVVLVATGIVRGGVELGTEVTWASGTPYSIERQVSDADNQGNLSLRTLFPTGRRNDQRNGGFWGLDARLAKRFAVGTIQIGVEAAVENLLDRDEVVVGTFNPSTGVDPGTVVRHRPGRAWQLGTAIYF